MEICFWSAEVFCEHQNEEKVVLESISTLGKIIFPRIHFKHRGACLIEVSDSKMYFS